LSAGLREAASAKADTSQPDESLSDRSAPTPAEVPAELANSREYTKFREPAAAAGVV